MSTTPPRRQEENGEIFSDISKRDFKQYKGEQSDNRDGLFDMNHVENTATERSGKDLISYNPMPEKCLMVPEKIDRVYGQQGDVNNDEDVPVLSDDDYYDDRFMDLIDEMDDSHNYSESNIKYLGENLDSY